MSHIDRPKMALQCRYCDHRPPEDSVMEAFGLHCSVEHDTDDLKMDLRAICSCGAAMDHTGTRETARQALDDFLCPACHNTATVHREPT